MRFEPHSGWSGSVGTLGRNLETGNRFSPLISIVSGPNGGSIFDSGATGDVISVLGTANRARDRIASRGARNSGWGGFCAHGESGSGSPGNTKGTKIVCKALL